MEITWGICSGIIEEIANLQKKSSRNLKKITVESISKRTTNECPKKLPKKLPNWKKILQPQAFPHYKNSPPHKFPKHLPKKFPKKKSKSITEKNKKYTVTFEEIF